MTQRILVLIGLLVVSQNVQGAARDGAARASSGPMGGAFAAVHTTPSRRSHPCDVAMEDLALEAERAEERGDSPCPNDLGLRGTVGASSVALPRGSFGEIDLVPADFVGLYEVSTNSAGWQKALAQFVAFQMFPDTVTPKAIGDFLKVTTKFGMFWTTGRRHALILLCEENGIETTPILACLDAASMRDSSY